MYPYCSYPKGRIRNRYARIVEIICFLFSRKTAPVLRITVSGTVIRYNNITCIIILIDHFHVFNIDFVIQPRF